MLDAVLGLNKLDTLVFDGAGPSTAPLDPSLDHITVPDAHLLFNGEFKRVGTSGLKITGEDGKSFFIENYFSSEKHKHLMSPEGALLTANVVGALAGPLAPGQHAQAGAQPAAAQPVIGRVDAMTGSCTVVRNGVSVSLTMGDGVRKGDVVQTSGSSTISIVFTDGSTFSLSANARMVLDEFVYNAGASNNSAVINLVQGTFSFVAGQVAKTGDMRVDTPVATMGIRGTAVLVEISANDGQTKFSVMVEPNGTTGSFNLYNKTNGTLIGTVNNSQVGWLVTPAGPLQIVAQQVSKTPAELQQELGIVQQLFTIFNNYQQNPIDPNQQPDPDRRGDNQNGPQNAGVGSGGSGGLPTTGQQTNYNVTITQVPGTNSNPPNPPSPINTGTGPNPNPNSPAGPDVGGLAPAPLQTGTFTVINGAGIIVGTTGNDHIFGSTGNDQITALQGDDQVFGGDGNDILIAGHGEGNDFYDGGAGRDTIKFESSTSGVTFQLNAGTITLPGGQVVKASTADGADIGHDEFVRVEEIVGGQGNDVFVLHDAGNWKIDGGAGNDTVRLDGNVSIRDGATTLALTNIENIDLNTTNANVIDLDVKTVIDANEDQILVVTGNSQDAVNFLNIQNQYGHWELVAESDRAGFNQYRFVVDGNYEEPDETLATVYVQEGINIDGVQGGPVLDHIIENVSVSVTDPEGYQLSNTTIIPDLLNATIESFGTPWGTPTVLLRVGATDLYYQITGNFEFNEGQSFSIKGGNVAGIAIGTIDGGEFTPSHAYSYGFDFPAADFFDAIVNPGDASAAALNAFLSSASYSFTGSEGADILVGSDFRDTFSGGLGNDILTGNGGPDKFIYQAGNDTVTDFSIGQDKIDLTAFNYIHSMADIGPRAYQDGLDTVITFGEGDSLRLVGVSLNNLSDSDFVFFQPEALLEKGVGEAHYDESSTAYKVLSPNGTSATFVSDGWTATPQDASEYNGHYFKFVSGNLSWTDAQAAALAMGGYLVTIGGSDENAFVHGLSGGAGAWIGATDSGNEGRWVWSNGPQGGDAVGGYYGYTGWWGDEPNGGTNENYAFIDHNGAWTDVPNTYGSVGGYVVEFNGQGYIKVGSYGTAIFNAATGELTYTLDNGDADTQALAGGQTVTESFDLAFLASNGQTITRTATFTIQGANDAPEFVLVEGDSTGATRTEGDAGLTANGTLHARDVDAGSQLVASVSDLDVDGSAGLSHEQLLGFFHASIENGQVTWTFDSGDEAFNALGAGESMILHYTVRVSDEHGAWDEQIVNVTVNGTNDAPVAQNSSASGNVAQSINVVLSAADDSQSVTFSLANAANLLTLGEFSDNGFSTHLSASALESLLVTSSNEGVFSKTLQFRPFEAGDYSFSFTANDHENLASGTGSAAIHVDPRIYWQNAHSGYALDADALFDEIGAATFDSGRTETEGSWTDVWWIDPVGGRAYHANGSLTLDSETGAITGGTIQYLEVRDYDAEEGIGYSRAEMGNLRIDAKAFSDAIELYKTDPGAGYENIADLFSHNPYSISGDSGNDVLRGYGFADNIYGWGGDDEITAGAGNDTLNGGAGHDTFVFSSGGGKDIITDMTIGSITNPNADMIRLDGFVPQDVTLVENASHDIRIVLGVDQWIDLSGVSYSEVNKNLLLTHNLQFPPEGV
ncbi:MAG: VCBS domain-containing protein [Pseudorhodoplanes sp.]